MSESVKLPINGAIVYWTMDDSPLQRVADAFEAEGYTPPKVMADTVALAMLTPLTAKARKWVANNVFRNYLFGKAVAKRGISK